VLSEEKIRRCFLRCPPPRAFGGAAGEFFDLFVPKVFKKQFFLLENSEGLRRKLAPGVILWLLMFEILLVCPFSYIYDPMASRGI